MYDKSALLKPKPTATTDLPYRAYSRHFQDKETIMVGYRCMNSSLCPRAHRARASASGAFHPCPVVLPINAARIALSLSREFRRYFWFAAPKGISVRGERVSNCASIHRGVRCVHGNGSHVRVWGAVVSFIRGRRWRLPKSKDCDLSSWNDPCQLCFPRRRFAIARSYR